MPAVDLNSHDSTACKDISGHWKGLSIDTWPTAKKKVVDIKNHYAVCDQSFSCRGSNEDEDAAPESWYGFSESVPATWPAGQIICHGNVIDLLYRDPKRLYYRFRFEILSSGDLIYSVCGGKDFLLKKEK
jgi:hypothetical protein